MDEPMNLHECSRCGLTVNFRKDDYPLTKGNEFPPGTAFAEETSGDPGFFACRDAYYAMYGKDMEEWPEYEYTLTDSRHFYDPLITAANRLTKRGEQ